MIALVRATPAHAEARLEQLTVRGHGGVAIAIWTEGWSDPGTPPRQGRVSGMDTWIERDGGWRIIATREARDAPQGSASP